jgi:hypothetical protein
VFSLSDHHLGAPTRVNSYFGLPRIWPGDTIGLVYLGDDRVTMAWGAGLRSSGELSINIFNVVVAYGDDARPPPA